MENDLTERTLFEKEVREANPLKIIPSKPSFNPIIDRIHYKIILCLNKSRCYEGVVKITITNDDKLPINGRDL
jgi:hypothetical protein